MDRQRTPALLSLLVFGITSTAFGDTASNVNIENHRKLIEPLPSDSNVEEYSPVVATALSVGGLLGSSALLALSEDSFALWTAGAAGLLVTPSLGHVYTGDWLRAGVTTGLRAGGAYLIIGAAFAGLPLNDSEPDDKTVPAVMSATGLVAFAAGTIYSIWDAPASARRANAKRRRVALVPMPIQTPGKKLGMGAQLSFTF